MYSRTYSNVVQEKMRGYEGPRWCCYYWGNGWTHVSFGISFYLGAKPNIEIHIPTGFIRIGRTSCPPIEAAGWVWRKRSDVNDLYIS